MRAAVLAPQQPPAIRQRRTDDPAVVGRVEAQIYHRVRCAVQIAQNFGLQFVLGGGVARERLHDLVRRAELVHGEAGLRGIVEVRFQQVERAVLVLAGVRPAHGQKRAAKERVVVIVAGIGRVVRLHELFRQRNAGAGLVVAARDVPERAIAGAVFVQALQAKAVLHTLVHKPYVGQIMIQHFEFLPLHGFHGHMPVIRREGGHGDEEMIVVCAERAAKMFARVMRTEAALHGEAGVIVEDVFAVALLEEIVAAVRAGDHVLG